MFNIFRRKTPSDFISELFKSTNLANLDPLVRAEFFFYYTYIQDLILHSCQIDEEKRRHAYRIALSRSAQLCKGQGDVSVIYQATENRINDHYFYDLERSEEGSEAFLQIAMRTLEHLCMKPSPTDKIVALRSRDYELDLDFMKNMTIKAKIAEFTEAALEAISRVRNKI